MLVLELPDTEIFNEKTMEIIQVPGQTLRMEHSLISLSKWESEHKKPFLKEDNKTDEELLDYFKAMIISPNINDDVLYGLGSKEYSKIISYINDPMTATTFGGDKTKTKRRTRSGQIYTSELIYYYMIAYGIPVQFEKWHLNRLLTLIRVCEIKNEEQSGGKKMSKRDLLKHNAALNAQRRAALNSKG